jgi:hypothetical protein
MPAKEGLRQKYLLTSTITLACAFRFFDDLAVDLAFGKSTRPTPNVKVSLPCNAQGQYAADRLAPKNDPSPTPGVSRRYRKLRPHRFMLGPERAPDTE